MSCAPGCKASRPPLYMPEPNVVSIEVTSTLSSVTFEAVHLGDELTMQGVKAATGAATVPQIFIGGKLIGGAQQLADYFGARRNAA